MRQSVPWMAGKKGKGKGKSSSSSPTSSMAGSAGALSSAQADAIIASISEVFASLCIGAGITTAEGSGPTNIGDRLKTAVHTALHPTDKGGEAKEVKGLTPAAHRNKLQADWNRAEKALDDHEKGKKLQIIAVEKKRTEVKAAEDILAQCERAILEGKAKLSVAKQAWASYSEEKFEEEEERAEFDDDAEMDGIDLTPEELAADELQRSNLVAAAEAASAASEAAEAAAAIRSKTLAKLEARAKRARTGEAAKITKAAENTAEQVSRAAAAALPVPPAEEDKDL
jgi:hypothetical protein